MTGAPRVDGVRCRAAVDLQHQFLRAEAHDQPRGIAEIDEPLDRAGKVLSARASAEMEALRPDADERAVADSQVQPQASAAISFPSDEAHDDAAVPALGHRSGEAIVLADEAGHEGVRRSLVEVGRTGELLDAPVVEHGDAVRHRQRLALVVRDVDHRDAEPLVQADELVLHALAQLLVERAERLVEQDQLRLEHERAGERHALLLSAGELRRPARAEAAELDHVERRFDPPRRSPAPRRARTASG